MRKGLRGLNLLETILATGLIALSLLVLLGVFTQGLRQLGQARQLTEATGLARDVLEACRVNGVDSLPPTLTVFDGGRGDSSVGGFPPAPYPGRGSYKVIVSAKRPTLEVRVYYSEQGCVRLVSVLGR